MAFDVKHGGEKLSC